MRIACVLVLAVAVVAAGCGGSGGGGNGEAGKPVNTILADTEAAAKNASSVHVAGSGVSGGTPLVLDLHLVTGKGGKGHLKVSGLDFDIVRVGTTAYFKGGTEFWSNFGGSVVAQLLNGRWLSAPADHGTLSTFAPLTDLQKLFDAILSTHGKLTKGETATVDGRKAFALVDHAKGGGTLYIAASGTPYPLELVSPGGKHGSIHFREWNKPVALAAPKNAVDVSKVKGLGG